MSDYSFLSRVLHNLALGTAAVGEASFDIEKGLLGKGFSPEHNAQHVFVAGLARSGTTVLMRSLYDTGQFCSLTYRDMPFVLAPNAWAKMSSRGARSIEATDRAHGDGVLVDFDSPEALEEVFWRVFCGERYIESTHLKAMRADDEEIARFRTYVAMILRRYSAGRYLSKNNNNVVRLSSIQAAFPNALTLIPYRQPLQQAYSLQKQHQHFSDMHESDAFSAKYMQWLVHHEFGTDHRPFSWGLDRSSGLTPASIDYWLAQWIGVYTHVLESLPALGHAVLPIGYERLCNETTSVWGALSTRLELTSSDASLPALSVRESEAPQPTTDGLLAEAERVYAALEDASRKLLTT